ncbi:jg23419 [Pararge aegeria aegeria]|uniref:Jg23419 protein n=1 Tax=Pararge aegeria aegeria TaxID=348720 RepID=A0A8S4QQE3_9NEOP|nr:jg23419 [Pararge aegeria aegeria]
MTKQGSAGLCICLRDCVSYRYRVELSIGNLMALPNLVQNPYAGIQFNKSTSILHFFHNSVLVKQKQETVMSLISLACTICKRSKKRARYFQATSSLHFEPRRRVWTMLGLQCNECAGDILLFTQRYQK